MGNSSIIDAGQERRDDEKLGLSWNLIGGDLGLDDCSEPLLKQLVCMGIPCMGTPCMPIEAIRQVFDAFICPRFTQLVASTCGLHGPAKPGNNVIRVPPVAKYEVTTTFEHEPFLDNVCHSSGHSANGTDSDEYSRLLYLTTLSRSLRSLAVQEKCLAKRWFCT